MGPMTVGPMKAKLAHEMFGPLFDCSVAAALAIWAFGLVYPDIWPVLSFVWT